MAMNKTFALYVYDGDYGLPSFDTECIKSILGLKLAKVPVSVKLLNTIKSCAYYNAPSFVDDKVVLYDYKSINKHLRKLHFNPDCGLSARQCSDYYAIESLVTTKLEPVLQFIQWIDTRNCDEFTSPWYMKAVPFPFNYACVKRYKDKAVQVMEALYPNENQDCLKEFIKKMASNTLSALSTRLGTSPYFFGETASTLDAVVYAYVAPLIKLPFPSNEISVLASMWPNLATFVKRMDSRYLPDVKSEVKYLKKLETLKQNDDEVSYLSLFILITSASTLMLCFAVSKGILRLSS